MITYTNKILPTDRFHLVTDTNQNLELMKLNPFAGKQSKEIDSWKKKEKNTLLFERHRRSTNTFPTRHPIEI